MAKNVEFKAKVADYDEMFNKVGILTNVTPTLIMQQDIFYGIKKGRLKLRTISNAHHEIIYYSRKNTLMPKVSKYYRFEVKHYDMVNRILARIFGEKEKVRKERYLFLKDNIRFHLDKVMDLGTFMEIEYIMSEKESKVEATNKVNTLLKRLDISPDMLIKGSYADMLREKME